MNNLKRSSLIAILVTIVMHAIAILFMNVSSIKTNPPAAIENQVLELDFTEEEDLEDPEKQEENKEQEALDEEIKDLMKDLNDKRKSDNKKYSESELEEMLLKEIEERNKQSVQELRDNGIKGFDPSKFEKETKKKNKADKTGKKQVKENQFAGKVTKYCDVPGRDCYTKTPTYKCNSGGKVHIDIKVDKIGRVKSAKVNAAKSTTTNQCILDEALKYAQNTTKVESDLDGKFSNTGYIIYNFISQ